MSDIEIHNHDQTYVKVISDDLGKLFELSEAFAFYVPNHRFHPKVRARVWDGKIRLYSVHTKQIYKGLIPHIVEFATSRGYTVGIDPTIVKSTPKFIHSTKEVEEYFKKLQPAYKGKLLTAMEHQVNGVQHILEHARGLLLSPTGSGKSLIIYALIRYYLENLEGKVLLIVPTVSLVTQMYKDFIEYSSMNKWDAEANCHCIYSGKEKTSKKQVIITTWQSAINQDPEYFEQFSTVMCDECFAEDTEILTPTGYKKIKDFVIGDEVLNLDSSGNIKVDYIINIHENLVKSFSEKMYRLDFDNGSFVEVTGNHKFLSKNRGWIRADEIQEEDELICADQNNFMNYKKQS